MPSSYRPPSTVPLEFVPPTSSLPTRRVAIAGASIGPTSGTATVAFLLALLGPVTFGIGSGAAIILGLAGWRATRTGERGGHGLTVAALFLGVIGLAAFLGMVWLLRNYPIPTVNRPLPPCLGCRVKVG